MIATYSAKLFFSILFNINYITMELEKKVCTNCNSKVAETVPCGMCLDCDGWHNEMFNEHREWNYTN